MKQTAVDWLVEKLKSQGLLIGEIDNLVAVKQAKEMEKEQIIEAHFTSSGCNSFDMPTDRINSAYKAAQEYYNETFKSE